KVKLALLTQKINVVSKRKSEKWLVAESFKRDKESLSSEDEGVTRFKAFIVIPEDEPTAGKTDARSGQWVKITMKKLRAQKPYATSSRKELKIPKPFIPCKYCGFNDHHSDECEYYPGCDICGSIAHEPSEYDKSAIHINTRPRIANQQSNEPTNKWDKMEYKGNNVVGALMNIPIFVGTFSILTDFIVLEDMDAYRNEGMDNVIFGEPFLREVGINAKRFEGIITFHNGNEEVTYQMARSHPRFKHHTNEQCNKILPLLKDLAESKEIEEVGEVSIIWNLVCDCSHA
nr:retrovirus-related Pol polyprotein from transposon TNT 1-94 [Tanacetum cinerariifolium]